MRRLALFMAALALLGGVAIGGSLIGSPPTLLHDLARERPARAFSARLSIDTKFRPCTPLPMRADSSTVSRERCGAVEEASVDLDAFAAAGESSDPDSLRASALAELIWWDGKEASLDKAIERLNRVLRITPHSDPLLVDLSGAHLVRAERTGNARDLVWALDYASEAVKREPRNQAALFNTALALQSTGAVEEAAKAWDAYLAVDSGSTWAEEARRRKREALHRPPVLKKPAPGASASEVEAFASRDHETARLLGWDDVLGKWGSAVEVGDTAGAALNLEFAERLGQALVRRGGDASLADAVRAIRAAASDPAATRTLARAHQEYATGQRHFLRHEHADAYASFARVIDARPPSPVLQQWTEAYRAGTVVYQQKFRSGNLAFKAVLSRMDSVRHPLIAARVRGMLGTSLLRQGKYAEALTEYRAATQVFERLGETRIAAFTRFLEGETLYEQGYTREGYNAMHRALSTLRHHRDAPWLNAALMKVADCAVDEGMPLAAEAIQEESFAVAMRTRVPLLQVDALLARARMKAASGKADLAALDLEEAAPLAERVEDETARKRILAMQHLSRALLEVDLKRSAAALDSAAALLTENAVWLLPVLTKRADARLALGDVDSAIADLDTITARIRGLSRKDRNASRRAGVIEQARARFDQLVMLHLRAGRTVEALQALERGRTSFTPAGQAGVAPEGGRPVAPPGHVAVEYALIGDTLLIWTIRHDTVRFERRPLSRGELVRTVEQVSAALETPARAGAANPGLRRMYDWLIRPAADQLGPRETPLIILADGVIAGVPFDALFDGERYLVQDHPLRFASTLADASRPRTPTSTRPGPVLLVANPEFDAFHHPTLDQLPGAREEVDSLNALVYPQAVRLDGPRATRSALAAEAQRASVIHYAGHAVFDDARPERSFLVLAGDGASGQLTAEAVDSLKLGGVRLVVLSACRTLRSRDGRSGGFAGLAGALLGAGAGGMVGSLWKVDDELTRPLMLAFHREYLESRDPAGALRQAQLQLLRSNDPALRSPAAWAGFRYAGR